MGLSRLFKKITRPVVSLAKSFAPVIGAVAPAFGPLAPAALGFSTLVAQRQQEKAQQSMVIPDHGPMAGFGGFSGLPAAMPVGFPIAGGGLASAASAFGMGSLIGGAIRGTAGLLRTAAGKVRGVMLASGQFISSRKGALLARRVGINAAAVALGISTVELAEMVLADQESMGRRRARGVSGADLRRTRRTIGTIERMHRQIIAACSSSGYATRPRRAAPRERSFVAPHRHKLINVK